MTTRILGTQIEEGTIQTAQLSNTTTAAFATTAQLSEFATTSAFAEFATSLGPKVSSVAVANSTFTVLDDTAVDLAGGYIVITGTNFASGVTVLIDTTSASAVTRVNSTTIRVQVPPKSAATYNLYVVNPDGGTGIRVNGITYSGTPTWVTASPLVNKSRNSILSLNLSATDATSYALAAGSTLPAGTSLLANGYFYGVPTGADIDTTYSFNIVATDAENQDSSKTFGITITAAQPATLYAWGASNYGQGGLGSTLSRLSSPTQIGSLTNWNTIYYDTNLLTTTAIKTDGTLWAWGRNFSGQFGNNTRGPSSDVSSPIQIGSDTNWKQVVMPYYGCFFLKTTGTLWWTGELDSNLTGISFPPTRSSPVQFGSSSDWNFIATSGTRQGLRQMYAIKTNGTLWAWGQNNFGVLGHNDVIDKSVPTQVGIDTNWKMLSAVQKNQTALVAIKTNGTLWAWGRNDYLMINGGTTGFISSPVQVGALSNWDTIHAGEGYTFFAIKKDGTLWTWGENAAGKLGINSSYDSLARASSPVQIGTDTNWKNVVSYGKTTVGVKTNGTLWTWGGNDNAASPIVYGYLGTNQGVAVNRSSPVQLGSNTNWSNVFAPNGNENQQGTFWATREV